MDRRILDKDFLGDVSVPWTCRVLTAETWTSVPLISQILLGQTL